MKARSGMLLTYNFPSFVYWIETRAQAGVRALGLWFPTALDSGLLREAGVWYRCFIPFGFSIVCKNNGLFYFIFAVWLKGMMRSSSWYWPYISEDILI